MKPYQVQNWYWFVGDDRTRVFASARGDFVPVSDPTFVSWKADGTVPTIIDTEANLGEVLSAEQVRPVAASVLDGYTSVLADRAVLGMSFKILFNHENRIRVLENRPQVTVQQFRTAIKGLM